MMEKLAWNVEDVVWVKPAKSTLPKKESKDLSLAQKVERIRKGTRIKK